jgi:hypothetical protein
MAFIVENDNSFREIMMGAARCMVLYRFFEKMIAAHSYLTVHVPLYARDQGRMNARVQNLHMQQRQSSITFIFTEKRRAYGCTNCLGKGSSWSHSQLGLYCLYQGGVPANVAV